MSKSIATCSNGSEQDPENNLKRRNYSNVVSQNEVNGTSKLATEEKSARKWRSTLYFGGSHGTIFFSIVLPFVMLTIHVQCSKESCTILQLPPFPTNLSAYFDLQAMGIVAGWLTFQAILFAFPLGETVHGQPIPNGKRLRYRLNGLFAFVTTLATLALLVYLDYPLEIIPEKFLALHVSALLFCYVFSLFLYIKSFTVPESHLSPMGRTGHFFYDFFMGRELNPRIGKFDIKVFFELRPGLIGWVAINVAFIVTDYKTNGNINPNLLLCSLGHFVYVFDALYFEEVVLTTMDITTEGLGFMLTYGDLTFVPFIFTFTPRFLFEHHYQMPIWALVPISLLTCAAYTVYRISNSQKHIFTRCPTHPSVKNFEAIPADGGRRLLVDGWWGWVRHPNYFGDLIMGLSWCLTSGFSHILPYTYSIYHLSLLTHRSMRDEVFCHEDFGSAWNIYCKRVKYRIFKYIH